MSGRKPGRAEAPRGADRRRALYPASHRLRSAPDFGRVFKRNRRIQDRHFTILARCNGLAHPRLGMAISRKACGKAVARNRIKRLLRETFRLSQHALPAVDVVVMARPGIGLAKTPKLRQSLAQLWQEVEQQCAG